MQNKTVWKNEAQFKRKLVEKLRKRGYLVYYLEAGTGATTGVPDLMTINKNGSVRFIETKCVPRTILCNVDKPTDKRFKFNGMQMGRFAEMWKYRKDVWIVIAQKGDKRMSAIKFSRIKSSDMITTANFSYLLNNMGYK